MMKTAALGVRGAHPAALNPYLFAALPLAVFTVFRLGVEYSSAAPGAAPACALLMIAAAVPFRRLRANEFAQFQRLFLQLAAALLAFYFASEPFAVPQVAMEAHHPAVWLHQYGRWLGVGLAACAWFRPAMLAPAAGLAWLLRCLNPAMTGFEFSVLDVEIVFEVIVFAASGFVLARAYALRSAAGRDFEIKAGMLVAAIAIGAHFGNYFHSALAKLALDGGVLSWVLENNMQDGVLGALEKGAFPFAAWPALTQAAYDGLAAVNLPLQAFALIAQFAAVICVARRRWIIAMTLVYDAFHLGVYLVYGLLFWKWIALNAIFVAMLAVIPDGFWTRPVKITCAVSVAFGALFFSTARLAWYDAPAFASGYFVAEDAAGGRWRVPAAYFGSASYQVSHAKFFPATPVGHFNPSIWGSVTSRAELEARRNCAPNALPPAPYTPSSIAALSAYAWTNHDALLAQADASGSVNPYLYVHHHMPSPFAARPFDRLDLRTVTRYDYVIESVCLGLERGRLTRNVVQRTHLSLDRGR